MIFLHKLILKLAFLGLGWAQVYMSQLGLFRNKFQQYLMKIHENKEENYNIFCHKIQIMRPKIGSVKYSSFELFLLGWVTDEERNNH